MNTIRALPIDYGRLFRNAVVMSRNDVMHHTVSLIRYQYFHKYANC
jgi:hypothetical protein